MSFLCVFSHKLYVDKTKCLNNLKEAQHLELNRETAQKVEDSGGTIPYAVISGKVKALTAPLRSEHLSSLRGVMQESIISEYKVRWVSSLNIWGPVNNNINRKIANVPFSLVGKSGLFQKTVSVEIGDPFSAQELVLSEVFNDYSKYDESLGEALKGFFSSEHIVGISQVENMLLENTSLTAIGKLTIENGNLKMDPPDGDLTYFLTPLSYESLYKQVNSFARLYKGATIVMGVITSLVIAYYFRKGFTEIRRRINRARDLKKFQEARKLKRNDTSRPVSENENRSRCVVCLENLAEVIVLECAHICLCLDCSELLNNKNCPMCRRAITRLIPVYFP